MRGLIALILGLAALYVFVIAAILTLWPFLSAIGVFFALLPVWLVFKLRTNSRLRKAAALMNPFPGLTFHFTVAWEEMVFPVSPLVIATAVSLTYFYFQYQRAGARVLSPSPYWRYPELAAAIAIVGLAPAGLAYVWRDRLRKILAWGTARYLNLRFAGPSHLLNAVVNRENEIRRLYEAVGVTMSLTASQAGRDAVLRHLTGPKKKLYAELRDTRDTLDWAAGELTQCVALRDNVEAAFTGTKQAVIESGSPTLLAELDEIHYYLESEDMAALYRKSQWDDIRDVYQGMIAQLESVRDIALRGEAETEPEPEPQPAAQALHDPDQPPRTLEDAYRVLHVRPGAPLDVIKKVVTSQLMMWHPDRVRDPAEIERCTARTQAINVAWDYISGRRQPSSPAD